MNETTKTENKEHRSILRPSVTAILRDIAFIVGILSSLVAFGPQILESADELTEARAQQQLYSAYTRYGQSLFGEERYAEATRSFEEATALRPHDFDAQVWLRRASLMDALGKLDSINEEDVSQFGFDLEFVIRSHPPDVYRYYFAQGNVRYFDGDYESALKSYELALSEEPEYGPALGNRGAALNELGRYEEAVKSLRAALDADYVQPSIYNNLTFGLWSGGQLDQAVEAATEGLQLFPTDPRIHNELGIALYRLGRLDESISALRASFVLTPRGDTEHLIQVSTNIAYPLADQGRWGEAVAYLQSAQELAEDNPYIYLAEAYTYNRAGEVSKALEAYEKLGSLGAYPDADGLLQWAELLARAEKPGEASRILAMAVESGRGNEATLQRARKLALELEDQQILQRLDALASAK